jgi:hypothetical protein
MQILLSDTGMRHRGEMHHCGGNEGLESDIYKDVAPVHLIIVTQIYVSTYI